MQQTGHCLCGAAASAFILLVSIGEGVATEADTMHRHAKYLDGPTEWCSAEDGIPVIVTIDGPDVFTDVSVSPRSRVKVRRGSDVREVETGTLRDSEVRVGRGTESYTTPRIPQVPERVHDPKRLGRFYAEVPVCHGFWEETYSVGQWRVVSPDGAEAASGEVVPPNRRYYVHSLLRDVWRGFPHLIQLDGHEFYILQAPEVTQTVEALASRDARAAE